MIKEEFSYQAKALSFLSLSQKLQIGMISTLGKENNILYVATADLFVIFSS